MQKGYLVISDTHFGNEKVGKNREEDFYKLVSSYPIEVELILLGDFFDFWFDYKTAIYSRYFELLCFLRRQVKQGRKIYFIPGNHDFYRTEFLKKLGIEVKYEGLTFEIKGKKLFLHHGDILNFKGRLNRWLYGNFINRFFFYLLHPDLGLKLANMISGTEENARKQTFPPQYPPKVAKKMFEKGYDVVILGHYHNGGIVKTKEGKIYINTGDWLLDRRQFVEINVDNGIIVLKDFRKGKIRQVNF